uniref:Uncharacterized protein n=1 Tax=Choristoneura fumiferana nuclear polyhedrosis virus TaxID=208973 RepID=Q6LCD2_NPVCF|nr:unknown [Choristoneura fumiferana multiple nucleopolyhedrovirus]
MFKIARKVELHVDRVLGRDPLVNDLVHAVHFIVADKPACVLQQRLALVHRRRRERKIVPDGTVERVPAVPVFPPRNALGVEHFVQVEQPVVGHADHAALNPQRFQTNSAFGCAR